MAEALGRSFLFLDTHQSSVREVPPDVLMRDGELHVAAATHVGRVRSNNEDAFRSVPALGLFVVADGMGGHVAGETAARLAVEAIEVSIRASAGARPAVDADRPNAARLSTAIARANEWIAKAVVDDETRRGMATTVVAVLIEAHVATIAHVGDSRAYLWHAGRLTQITADHAWVADQVRAGLLTEADAQRHPWRHVLTRALAGSAEGVPDVQDVVLAPGDRLLLCTDGLSGVLSQTQLERLIGTSEPLAHMCDALVDAANDAGGPDNVTVVIVERQADRAI
jgi:protein phosphatase